MIGDTEKLILSLISFFVIIIIVTGYIGKEQDHRHELEKREQTTTQQHLAICKQNNKRIMIKTYIDGKLVSVICPDESIHLVEGK